MYPCFTKKGEFWILLQNAICPFGHKIKIIVRIGINSESIYCRSLYPPDMALGQIILNVWVLFVHIGHCGNKPAFDHFLFVICRGIRIKNCLVFVRCLRIGRPFIEPVGHRFVFYRPMITSDMIGHHIKNQFHLTFMQLFTQLDIGIVATKTGINMIGFGVGITMI
ncbi:hypothetical protein D3C72_1566370 [compost metagenome]